jgi:hypothetical protein
LSCGRFARDAMQRTRSTRSCASRLPILVRQRIPSCPNCQAGHRARRRALARGGAIRSSAHADNWKYGHGRARRMPFPLCRGDDAAWNDWHRRSTRFDWRGPELTGWFEERCRDEARRPQPESCSNRQSGRNVGGDKCELGFRVAVRSASRSP